MDILSNYTGSLDIQMYGTSSVLISNDNPKLNTSKLKLGDKIIYLGYLLRTGNKAIHEVVDVSPNGVEVKNKHKAGSTHIIADVKEFCTLKDAKKYYLEEFI